MNSSYDSMTDELVALCKSGDEDAFEQLVGIYKPMLIKTARDLSLDFDEVYSDACLSLRRAALSYKIGGDVTFGLYAKICLTRSMLDYARCNKATLGESDFNIEDVAVSDGVQTRLEREEEYAALDSVARSVLSELEYEVFVLYMKGYKTSEMAGKLEITPKSVDNAKARMLKRLRTELNDAPKN